MSLYLPYLLLTLVMLGASYALGYFLLVRKSQLSTDEPYFSTFAALLGGVSAVVVGYAALQTLGNTMLLPVLLLLAALRWQLRWAEKKPAVGPPRKFGHLGALGRVAVVGAAVYTARIFLLYDPDSSFLRTPFQDYIYYSRLSTPLNAGLETKSLEAFFPQFVAVEPYHYFELWLNALLVKLTGRPALWCLYLATYSVLITIVGIGIRAVLAHFQVASRWAWVLTALLLLTGGVSWPIFGRIPLTATGGGLNAVSLLFLEAKLATVYLFLIGSVLLLLRRRFAPAGMVLAALPLVYVSTGPAVIGGTVVFTIYLLLTRRVSRIEVLWMVLPLVGTTLFFSGFYWLQRKAYQLPGTPNVATELLVKPSEARTVVNLFLGMFVIYALYYGVYGAVYAAAAGRRGWRAAGPGPRAVLVLVAGMGLSAAAMCSFALHYPDGYQFSQNVVTPLFPILLAVLLGAAFPAASTARRLVATGLLLGCCVYNYYPLFGGGNMNRTKRYSADFLRQVKAVLPTLGNKGAYLLGDAEYENTYMLSEDMYTAGNYIANFANGYAFPALSLLDVDSVSTDARYARDSIQSRLCLQNSSMYRYLRLHPQPAASLDSLRYRFVAQYGIRFVCVSAAANLPETLRPLVTKAVVDTVSGEKFYVLRAATE
ncbi:MAG TPA: hypothetical protein VF629_09640 [Hymenobacter sp.]|jgi:hypothetical protein|uniref:hypothetical protein n=1 Tax=Hymenobacter sp. TaxID=1898978 RepID=UPI002EDB9978